MNRLFINRDEDFFPEPYMLLADGGFHKRTCFIWPDLMDVAAGWGRFNFFVSAARCIIENAIGLFKMKWRRFHKHQIVEDTDIIPDLIICGCILHNICIDAGDVNRAEEDALNDDAPEDREAIRAAFNRVLSSQQALMGDDADNRVEEGRSKRNRVFDYWINYNLDKNVPPNIDEIELAFGNDAFLPFF
jgi:hypothetical protein